MKTIFINGKFLLQRTTGVQRFAREVLLALDRNLQIHSTKCNFVLLTQPGVPKLDGLTRIEQVSCGKADGSSTWWEQVALPWASRKGVLLCLSGSAPMLGGIRIPTIHDSAVYLYPQAYSWKFVFWYRILFRVVTRAAPLVLTVSANSAVDLAYHLPGRLFKVVPNAAEHIISSPSDLSILSTLGVRSGQFLLAVGSHNPTKNLSALISAYAQLGLAPKLPLVIVGTSNSSVFATGVFPSESTVGVFFAGAVSDAELRTLYENALAFVFPSLYEGFGIPTLEAMSCGCPVVASNASSIPEVCADAAIYFDAKNVSDIARALRIIVNDTALRADLSMRGRARSELFSWDNSAVALRRHLLDAGLLEGSRS